MSYERLRTEILTDPAGLGYGGKTAAEVHAILHDSTLRSRRNSEPSSAAGVMKILGAQEGANFLNSLESLEASIPAVKWAMRLINTRGIDLSDDETIGMLDYLAANGMLDAQSVQKIKVFSFPACSRADELRLAALPGEIEDVLKGV